MAFGSWAVGTRRSREALAAHKQLWDVGWVGDNAGPGDEGLEGPRGGEAGQDTNVRGRAGYEGEQGSMNKKRRRSGDLRLD